MAKRKGVESKGTGAEILALLNMDPAANGWTPETVIAALPHEGTWSVHRVGKDVLVIEPPDPKEQKDG